MKSVVAVLGVVDIEVVVIHIIVLGVDIVAAGVDIIVLFAEITSPSYTTERA